VSVESGALKLVCEFGDAARDPLDTREWVWGERVGWAIDDFSVWFRVVITASLSTTGKGESHTHRTEV
jgi:hypothetical protein